MKRKGIRNLIIDFGGVLIDLDRPRCIERFRQLGLRNVEEMLDICDKQGFFQQYEEGKITTAEFREQIRRQIGKPVTDGEIGKPVTDDEIDAAWNSFLVGIPDYKLELLLELRKDYVVYLLSNTNELHWLWSCEHAFRYKTFRAEDFFEQIYLSFEMQVAKPNAEIFQRVLDDADILPEETLFIDDSEANCRTAEALGISTYTPEAGEDWSHLFG